jgi:sortase A
VNEKPFDSWTRTDEKSSYHRSKVRRRLGRGTLALLGVALILLSVGWVVADVQEVGNVEAVASPKSERLKLSVPKLKRVRDIPVYTGEAGDKSKLAAGALHLEDTGFPWQAGSNVYIAGHRLGYPRTKSWLVFWHLNNLKRGNKVVLEDAAGRRYEYEVFDKEVVEPNDSSVKKSVKGKNIVTLQTCTLPDYKDRLIVRAQLVPNN